MISIVLEQYGVPRPSTRNMPTIPTRPLPSVYYRKPVKVHNPRDLSDDAPAAKNIHRQHVARSTQTQNLGFRPTVGANLTPTPHK